MECQLPSSPDSLDLSSLTAAVPDAGQTPIPPLPGGLPPTDIATVEPSGILDGSAVAEATGGSPGATSSPPLSIEDEDKRMHLLNKIANYLRLFKEKLEGYRYEDFEAVYDIPRLEQLYKALLYRVRSGSNITAAKGVYYGAMKSLEQHADFFGLNLAGLSVVLSPQNKELDSTLTEVIIEKELMTDADPMVRLGIITILSIKGLHDHNTANAVQVTQSAGVQATSSGGLDVKYHDL